MRTRTRVVMAALGLALAAVVVATVLIAPRGTGVALPDQVRRISPAQGAIVLRQVGLEIDMEFGYEIDVVVDGVPIPDQELTGSPEIGLFRWAPSSDTFVPEWSPGEHTVELSWNTTGPIPDPGTLVWTFTAQ